MDAVRELLPVSGDAADLHAVYARDWVETGGVRANFVASLDGAATVDGSSRGLQTPGDRAVFAVLRDLADVVLVGRATAQNEGYRALRPTSRRLEARARFGLPAQLPIVVVSASLDLDLTGPLFDYAGGAARTVVVTVAGAEGRHQVAAVADVVIAGSKTVDFASALAQLRDRGARRILTEGGPRLFGALLAAGAVDELCLTTVPRLVGTASHRIVHDAPALPALPALPAHAALLSLLEEDGATFARYRLHHSQQETPNRTPMERRE